MLTFVTCALTATCRLVRWRTGWMNARAVFMRSPFNMFTCTCAIPEIVKCEETRQRMWGN